MAPLAGLLPVPAASESSPHPLLLLSRNQDSNSAASHSQENLRKETASGQEAQRQEESVNFQKVVQKLKPHTNAN